MAYVTEKRGVHYAVIYEGRNPVTLTERRRWYRCDDRADAERVAAELTAARERLTRCGSSMTVRDYMVGRWLPARETTIAASTHARECAAVAHYLLPHLGSTQLRRLRPEHIQTLYRRLALTGSRTGGPLAAKTILNLHQTLRAALNDATTHGLLAINPIDGVRPPDPRTRPSGRRRARSWTATELGTFLDATAAGRHASSDQPGTPHRHRRAVPVPVPNGVLLHRLRAWRWAHDRRRCLRRRERSVSAFA